MSLAIVILDSKKHIRDTFSCGEESLDNYIKKRASQELKKLVSTTFVLTDSPDNLVLGYYTISAYSIEATALDDIFAKSLPRYPLLPATLLGRLAVDKSQKGKGYGGRLLVDAMKTALDTSKRVASTALVVDAIDENAMNFYTKYGFRQFKQEPMKLYYSMTDIGKLDL
jgi:predicted GNAT family N-acyltransferase